MSDEADVRWVSYQELADARGIDRLSAVRTTRNRRWEKRKGNDGTIRVAVPRNFLENAKRREKENPGESQGEIPEEIPRIISVLEGQVEALRGLVRTLEAHNTDVRAERDRALTRIAELERQLAEQGLMVSGDTSLPDEILAAISADLEQSAPLQEVRVDESAAADDRLGVGQEATTDAVSAEPTAPMKERPWRWWRRILRRRTA